MARSTSISPGPGLTLRGSLHRACLIHQHGASAPSRSTAAHRIGQIAAKPGWEEAVERIGKCHCGSFRVIAMGEPDRVYLCNCKACQRRTGTAFHFCANCGTTLYWEGDRNPAVCGVAAGAFDTSAFPPPSDSIWEKSMYPWLGLPARMGHHQQSRPPVTNQTNKVR